jgi:hypothetical protein
MGSNGYQSITPYPTGKKRANYNPYAGRLLTNPFGYVSDSHPIEHQIKRAMITDELKSVVTPTLKLTHIAMGMMLKKSSYPISTFQAIKLSQIRDSILAVRGAHEGEDTSFSFRNFIMWLEGDGMDDPCRPFRLRNNGDLRANLLLILHANSHNRYIKELCDIFGAQAHPSKTRKKINRITKKKWRPMPQPENQHADNQLDSNDLPCLRYSQSRTCDGREFHQLVTQEAVPLVKRATWMPYFWMSRNPQTSINPYQLRRANNRRSTPKINWWEFIKGQSGKYKPVDKSQHEQRLIASILNQ